MELEAQFKLFHKYWYSGSENDNVKDFQTADQLRKKIIPQIELLLNEENSAVLSDFYSDFSEFLFEYLSLSSKLNRDSSSVLYDLKTMAERAIKLNSDSFPGYYFLAIHHSWNLKRVHAGDIPTVYKGEDTATSIVGTAFNLLFKGATLGATATAAGISKSNFTNSIQSMIAVYRRNVHESPIEAIWYIKMTARMFHMADYCEDMNIRIWRDIYQAVKDVDIDQIDYSSLDDDRISEAQEAVMEFSVLADSKV